VPVDAPASARPREVYIDAFRGLMALVMVQGHVCDTLLTPAARAAPLYVFQTIFHGSTAPGFLFASGLVAGLPRAPLSLRASWRRARRLLFVLGVGYALHLPYLSFWKTRAASAAEKAALFACDALQVIAVTQLFVILLQLVAGRRWTRVAGALGLVVLAVTPIVWSSGVSARLPPFLGAYLDQATGSRFPVFPFSAFVLAGTLAGATIGRAEPRLRKRRAVVWGLVLLAAGFLLAIPLEGRVDFWGPSPAYVLVRLGALLLLVRLVEFAADAGWPGLRALALLGHETLLVYVLHLTLLFGGVLRPSPLVVLHGRLGYAGALFATAAMVPVLLLAAALWRRVKSRAPHGATLTLAFLAIWLVYEFLTRPW
jgi:fucose 4-O-acetylase-like acetyltransferase